MSNDGFIDKAGDAARKLFGDDPNAGKSYASEAPRKVVDYPKGDDVVEPGAASHYGAAGETRIGGDLTSGDVAGDRARYDDDPHYQETRAAYMGAFDQDYHEYRREHATATSGDFATWRKKREAANSLALGESPAQGSDGPHILDRSFSGTYDKD